MSAIINQREQGFSLVELLIAFLIAALLMTGALSVMALVAQNETQSAHLNERIIQSELMKSALNNTATDAGGLIAPTIATNSSSSNSATSTTEPFNLFAMIDSFLFGDCDSSSLISTILNGAMTLTSQLLTGHGYITGNNTSVSSSNQSIPTTNIPNPITVTTNQVNFYYLMEDNGSQELCHGTLTVQNNTMDYTLSGNNTSGTSACTPNGSTEERTRFMVGPGWSFAPLSTSSGCLGAGFKNNTGAQLTAVQSAQNGLPGTEVSICLPNM